MCINIRVTLEFIAIRVEILEIDFVTSFTLYTGCFGRASRIENIFFVRFTNAVHRKGTPAAAVPFDITFQARLELCVRFSGLKKRLLR